MPLDTQYDVKTPEGISLQLSPAGPVPRMLAWSIDIVIRLAINGLLYIGLAFFGKTGLGIALIITFLLEWFYPVYFELYHKGQTPGKKAFDIYVAMENATPVSPGASITRNLLRFVDFLPFFYGFGFISMILTRRFQRLGDLVAGTVVLHKALEYPAIEENETTPITPPVALNIAEQQALIRYQQRFPYLTLDRANELATLTAPLVEIDELAMDDAAQADLSKDAKNTANQPSSQLLGMANWIMGARNK